MPRRPRSSQTTAAAAVAAEDEEPPPPNATNNNKTRTFIIQNTTINGREEEYDDDAPTSSLAPPPPFTNCRTTYHGAERNGRSRRLATTIDHSRWKHVVRLEEDAQHFFERRGGKQTPVLRIESMGGRGQTVDRTGEGGEGRGGEEGRELQYELPPITGKRESRVGLVGSG
ncbi:unnamed protein product [Calypogeia fissa]